MRKELASSLALLATAAALAASLSTPAQASSYRDCSYPYVCLYNGAYDSGSKLVQYKDTYLQTLSNDRKDKADSVVNTRNDDSVWLIDTRSQSNSRYLCIPANTQVNLGDYALSGKGTWANDVDAIRIWSDNGLCSGTPHVTQGIIR
ncbi:peptidase inhibitor family I36 protein [Streptomyces cavernae]|uniref:peptidase inhibitor family I36 protein n=1 Tax=Streptomyces cavernae TaxID=2259034 RepID=UPI001EE489FB|nr:peptidase inhibitor family I36 protein [Streptomyces cavernae]